MTAVGIASLLVVLAAANMYRSPERFRFGWTLLEPNPMTVELVRADRGPIVETITASGTIEPVEQAEIAPQIVGRVSAVLVKDGDRVEAGDLLVQLDPTSATARLESASARISMLEAAISKAQADLEKAARDLSRTEVLSGRNVSSVVELADARTAYRQAQAALEMANGELTESQALRRTSQEELSYTEIRAPIAGVVCGCEVEVGEVVIAGTTNLPGSLLMTIAQMDRMRIRADVDETDVPLVRPGQPANSYLQHDLLTPIPGTVESVAPMGELVDEVVTFETFIRLDDGIDAPLRPGMTATVEIEVRRAPDALGVPVQAVVHRRIQDLPDSDAVRSWIDRQSSASGERNRRSEVQYAKVVFVVDDGIARLRPVEVGLSDERVVEIRRGLGPNDRVVAGPFHVLEELADGDSVVAGASIGGQDGRMSLPRFSGPRTPRR